MDLKQTLLLLLSLLFLFTIGSLGAVINSNERFKRQSNDVTTNPDNSTVLTTVSNDATTDPESSPVPTTVSNDTTTNPESSSVLTTVSNDATTDPENSSVITTVSNDAITNPESSSVQTTVSNDVTTNPESSSVRTTASSNPTSENISMTNSTENPDTFDQVEYYVIDAFDVYETYKPYYNPLLHALSIASDLFL